MPEVQLFRWGVGRTLDFWKLLREQLKGRYRLKIVVVYRRWHEWITSLKNQGDKYSLGRQCMKAWPPQGPEKEPIFPHLSRWMRNKSEIPSPFAQEIYDAYAISMV